ncbi:aromatic ring-hydroxylating dioxygenase subunit alpha [Sphingomonas sp. BGYR3]|uniref:aromatic ring-hydroxylating oxygenase subunit alpha n=1 Tax=Sphingomonas sp. BGYR3 TaxID=2975483 RepID=UPI0021A62009|nr:aromatic ring-hydroxylating dioxygenase subunit alpha [Sphingomonas sp. BGYR3]MDG5487785.1 aromatic ring-hydroxylating dioxygenase subunit alpha [Sphingomonas sp. BGYR3]
MADIVENAWHAIGYSEDFAAGELVPLQLLGHPLVVTRSDVGLVALEDRCSHRFAPLSKGRCEGVNIRCMYHGLLFAPDGRCIEIPGQDKIPPRAAIRRFAIVEQGGWVFVWGGAPEAADESLLPPFVAIDSPDYFFVKGRLDYAASNDLINANLLDFTHLTFVHPASFGADESWAQVKPTIQPIANGVAVEWWVETQAMPGTDKDNPMLVDLHTSYEYLVPGYLIMRTEPYPLGTVAQLSASGKPPCGPLVSEVHGQAVTALSATTSRYFFTWGVPRTMPDAETLIHQRLAMAQQAFAEDKAIIEAQHAIIASAPADRAIMPTGGDKAITLFERAMARRRDTARRSNSCGPIMSIA